MLIKKILAVTASVMVLSLGGLLLAKEKQGWELGKKGTISVEAGTRVGNQVLEKAGSYQVRCEHRGATHEMVFTRYSPGRSALTSEVTRVPCRAEELPEKVTATQALVKQDPGGQQYIAEIRVAGEKVKHLF